MGARFGKLGSEIFLESVDRWNLWVLVRANQGRAGVWACSLLWVCQAVEAVCSIQMRCEAFAHGVLALVTRSS